MPATNLSAEGADWERVWEGVSPPQPIRGSEPPAGSEVDLLMETYFEVHRTLFFAPVYQYFEFGKQCFMSQLRAMPRFGDCPLSCPNVELLLLAGSFMSVALYPEGNVSG